jgi:hypothetical protein
MKLNEWKYGPNIRFSKRLRRKIRADRPSQLGIPTWDLAKRAVREGNPREAIALIDYLNVEGKRLHDLYGDWVFALLNYISQRSEEEVYQALRYSIEMNSAMGNPFGKPVDPIPLQEFVQVIAEAMRSHRSGPKERGSFKIKEDKRKYVMTLSPCGSGGRMGRTGEVDNLPPRTGPPFFFGKTQKPYFWSWGKAGVPYYCAHCCVLEILDTERFGFPRRVIHSPEKPGNPCVWIFYKNPQDIPDSCFERIGQKKDPSRFKSIPVRKAQ